MSQTVLKQIADLERRSLPELQDRWRQLIGTEPPRYTREFLVKRLAYRLQELAHGGLRQETREQMNQLLDDAGYNELAGLRAGARPRAHRDQPVVGTRLVREWDGRRYEVTVVHGGFEFEGRRYRSLSAIAKTITGTHWNGPAFFGLRSRGRNGRADQ
jgi:hypothetical protein